MVSLSEFVREVAGSLTSVKLSFGQSSGFVSDLVYSQLVRE